jgi:hypothetical protein
MIQPEKYENALRALNAVLVVGRQMAYEKAGHEQLAEVLDVAEELPTLFIQKDDRTDYFRQALQLLAEKYPGIGFGLAVERFDGRA